MEFPIIDIKDETNGVVVKKPARKITKHLAVAYSNRKYNDNTFRIYSIHANREAIPHRIATYEDAVKIAQLLADVYGDYWDIHDHPDWVKANIPQLAQYGDAKCFRTNFALCKLLDKDTITFTDLEKAIGE